FSCTKATAFRRSRFHSLRRDTAASDEEKETSRSGFASPILRIERTTAAWRNSCPAFSPRVTEECKPVSVIASHTSAAPPFGGARSFATSTEKFSLPGLSRLASAKRSDERRVGQEGG